MGTNSPCAFKARRKKLIVALALALAATPGFVYAGQTTLDTSLPKDRQQFDIPAGSLSQSLSELSQRTGRVLIFDPALTRNKTSPALKGSYTPDEAFNTLLRGSGLDLTTDDKGEYQLRRTPQVDSNLPEMGEEMELEAIQVRAKRFYEVGPLPGLGLTKEEIPGNVQSITAKEIKDAHALSLTELMNSKLQSVNVNDYQSNPFQMDVTYRGFTAGPQIGTSQGLSVFLDGIRVNEPFGDVVNWDMIPMNALASLDVFPGSNPIFGLGTLGGALTMRTKSGFDGKTLDAEVLTGSFGRKQLQTAIGGNNGKVAGFVSGNFFLEDGWRDDSPSRVNQVFGKAEWQNESMRIGLSALYAGNKLTGNGLLPQQMVDQNPKQVYTSPDKSENDLLQFQLSGIWDVTDTFNITAQVYNRNSKRKTSTADVNENFGGRDSTPRHATVKDNNRQLLPGLPDTNNDGKPDYYNYALNVAADEFGQPLTTSGTVCVDPFDSCVNNLAYGTDFNTPAVAGQGEVLAWDGSGDTILSWTYDPRAMLDDFTSLPPGLQSNVPGAFNAPVTPEYDQLVRYVFNNQSVIYATNNTVNGTPIVQMVSSDLHPGTGSAIYAYEVIAAAGMVGTIGQYTDTTGFAHYYYEVISPLNLANLTNPIGAIGGGITYLSPQAPVAVDANGQSIYRDGRHGAIYGTSQTGYIEGTPTALFTDTEIDQVGKGGAIQFNWNLEQHKFMVGASVDKSDSTYASKEYLGMLDDKRHGFVAPELLGWEYYANAPERAVSLNDFSGDSITKSIYASETWTPTKSLNITASARFNHTVVNSKLAVTNLNRISDVNDILNLINSPALCPDSNGDGVLDPATECPNGLGDIIPFHPDMSFVTADGLSFSRLRPPEKEEFSYRSFNPALGATWQANETLNVYANWNRGARTPTVVELGCAFDATPVATLFDPVTGQPVQFQARSLAERRWCNLPGAMSGDPYLEQVRSETWEIGARGNLTPDLEWNAALYRTDLQDDIYMVSVNAQRSFFENIGDTRRQGLELGLRGRWGKARFGVNYSLTDATFQSAFNLISPHNSSAGNVWDLDRLDNGTYQQIQVKPGNRMPGIPLHNLNAFFSYDITDKWNMGVTAVVHSSSYVRGNENNKHRAGPGSPDIPEECINTGVVTCQIDRTFGPGKTAGYAVVNFRTSYSFTPEWTLSLLVNNIFDKEYATAGRLGLNAFSPSINGLIGAGGFNYNSNDWQRTSFLGIGAPRAAWVSLSYEFRPD